MGASPCNELMEGQSASAPLNAARRSIVVKVPVQRAYQQWARVEDLPKFITPLQKVRRIDDTRFSYTWHPDGEERQGVLHIVLQIPGRRIAWRTFSNALMSGVVLFEPRSERETEVTFEIISVFAPSHFSLARERY